MARANRRIRDLSRRPRTGVRRFIKSGNVFAYCTASMFHRVTYLSLRKKGKLARNFAVQTA